MGMMNSNTVTCPRVGKTWTLWLWSTNIVSRAAIGEVLNTYFGKWDKQPPPRPISTLYTCSWMLWSYRQFLKLLLDRDDWQHYQQWILVWQTIDRHPRTWPKAAFLRRKCSRRQALCSTVLETSYIRLCRSTKPFLSCLCQIRRSVAYQQSRWFRQHRLLESASRVCKQYLMISFLGQTEWATYILVVNLAHVH